MINKIFGAIAEVPLQLKLAEIKGEIEGRWIRIKQDMWGRSVNIVGQVNYVYAHRGEIFFCLEEGATHNGEVSEFVSSVSYVAAYGKPIKDHPNSTGNDIYEVLS